MAYSSRTKWFMDERNATEKQEQFLNRLMIMRSCLLDAEEKNLKNALQRLDIMSHPRQKPIVLQGAPNRQKYQNVNNLSKNVNAHHWSHCSNSYKKKYSEALLINEKTGMKSAKLSNENKAGLCKLKDTEILHVAKTLKATSFENFSRVVQHPEHLPSIPNVGRRADVASQNQYRKMTTGFQHVNLRKSQNAQGPNKYVALMQYPEKKQTVTKKKAVKISPKQLKFNVDINDRDLFRHSNTELAAKRMVTSPDYIAPENTRLDIPKICIDIDDSKTEDETSAQVGELNHAYRQFAEAQSEFQQLAEELEDISNTINKLESS